MIPSPKHYVNVVRTLVALACTMAATPATADSGPPAVHLQTYTGKPSQTFSFSGSGFAPGEPVDAFLGDQTADPLITVTADTRGEISGTDVAVPFLGAGDYKLTFVGRTSQTPASVGFNVQGFHPWVVLRSYYISPQSGVGFAGEDFVPGEAVAVYLNTRTNAPVAQVTADSDGRITAENAVALQDLTGDNTLIFVGEHSQTEVTATFTVAKD
ncbi:MAG: hypothetical protein JO020_15090 [Chloroflexi bacterium]|nr:hypothetical protein [Chloroflexota bacterium]MBV9895487.1 hypothetical protein [Chloroflexota bacterium]